MNRLYLMLLLLSPLIGVGQNSQLDSLQRVLSRTRSDTSRVLLLAQLAQAYGFYSADSSEHIARRTLQLARKLRFLKGEGRALNVLAHTLRDNGEFPQALSYSFQAVKIAQTTRDQQGQAMALFNIGLIYSSLAQYKQALDYFHEAETIFRSISDLEGIGLAIISRNGPYKQLNQPDSVKWIIRQVEPLLQNPSYKSVQAASSFIPIALLLNRGWLETRKGNTLGSLPYYRKALLMADADHNTRSQCQVKFLLAQLFDQLHQKDSSLLYARLALASTRYVLKNSELSAASLLAKLYAEKGQLDSAYTYQRRAQVANDQFFGRQKFQELQLLLLAEQKRQQELVSEQKDYQNQIRFLSLLAGLVVLLSLAFILYRSNRQKHRANQLLNEQKAKVEQALETLRTTQTQLIQREKMASLGELTAGIAHEIQNPLNFVNNFSEVSVELVEELKDELDRGDTNEAKSLADDLVQNLQRITQNGQRASNIVRGMLEHSRTSTGERLPTDLNALCDEYFRLAYQGAWAKNSSFTCQLETHFDPNLPLVAVVASDMSRVLLNLFNNAFYAVGQKQKTAPADYMPTVSVSTRKLAPPSGAGGAEIRVRDNGIGIPDAIRAKIFQPFFTTKPTGEGTGLGLSLAYDIVNAYGGSLSVQSDTHGSNFIFTLPKTS